MPFINVHIGKPIDEETKKHLMLQIASCMPIIPYRNIDNTMIEISDNRSMYMGGEKRDLIFVDMRVWGKVEHDIKNQFILALLKVFNELLSIPNKNVYFTMIECDEWGMEFGNKTAFHIAE